MYNNSLLAIAATTLLLLGCNKENPESSFTTDQDIYKVKQSIQFTNESENGLTYYWDFGDGESSNLVNPGHTYLEAGEYIVTLQVEGAKKTTASEFNKKLTIADIDSNVELDLVFANTTWVSDSTTNIYYNCDNNINDNSTNFVNHSMIFNEDNTVLMLNSNYANLCEYEVLNDSLIGFFEDPYYRTWSYSIDGDRLTLTNNSITSCPDSYPDNAKQGQYMIRHFYKE